MKNDGAVGSAVSLAVFSVLVAICAISIWFFLGRGGDDGSLGVSADVAPTVIIDPGHGGIDGGCVSALSVSEASAVGGDASQAMSEGATGEIFSGITAPFASGGAYEATRNDGADDAARSGSSETVVAAYGENSDSTASVGASVIVEKECNLAISEVLAALFRISGYNVIMTRDTDVMLDSDSVSGSAKMRDLKARLEIARAYPDALFISIHCNKFPDPSCSGLQVYYSPNDPRSGAYAESVQSSVVSLIQPTNTRRTKAATSSIYLLDRATQPAILVECGFLSNPAEARLLASPAYQKQLALAILCGLVSV